MSDANPPSDEPQTPRADDEDGASAPKRPATEGPSAVGRPVLIISMVVLALPPLVPILVAFWPEAVPLPIEVQADTPGMLAFLVGLAAIMLLFNAGFLYLLYRWLNRLGQE